MNITQAVPTAGAQAPAGGVPGPVAPPSTAGLGRAPSVDLPPAPEAAALQAQRATSAELDPPLVDLPVEISAATLGRLMGVESGSPAGAALRTALEEGGEAGLAQFKQDYPALYAQALEDFNAKGLSGKMSLFDLLALLQAKGVACSISLLQSGGVAKAQSLGAIIALKLENAANQFSLAATTAKEGMKRVAFTAASGVASAGIAGVGVGAGIRAVNLRSTSQPAEGLLNNTAAALPPAAPPAAPAGPGGAGGPGAGLPAADPFAPVAHNSALGQLSPVNAQASRYDALVQNSYGLSQGASTGLSAGATKSEVDTSVAGAETQGETSENDAGIAAAEAVKSGAEQNAQGGDQTASSIISGISQTVASLAQTTKEVSG